MKNKLVKWENIPQDKTYEQIAGMHGIFKSYSAQPSRGIPIKFALNKEENVMYLLSNSKFLDGMSIYGIDHPIRAFTGDKDYKYSWSMGPERDMFRDSDYRDVVWVDFTPKTLDTYTSFLTKIL